MASELEWAANFRAGKNGPTYEQGRRFREAIRAEDCICHFLRLGSICSACNKIYKTIRPRRPSLDRQVKP